MRLPRGLWKLLKEILRHLLRRPVAGLMVLARDPEGKILLVRRADSGSWALPGGTVEWGETFRTTAVRELREEAGAHVVSLGALRGAFSEPSRDPRFHAVTVVVEAQVAPQLDGPDNPLEIREAVFFAEGELPADFSHGTGDILRQILAGPSVWE